MSNITLTCVGDTESKEIKYAYKCREEQLAGAKEVVSVIPEIETRVSLSCEKKDAVGYIKEGYAFSPMFTLGYTTKLKDKEVFATWLNLAKAKISSVIYLHPDTIILLLKLIHRFPKLRKNGPRPFFRANKICCVNRRFS